MLSTTISYNNEPMNERIILGSVDPTINPKKITVIRIEPVEQKDRDTHGTCAIHVK